MGTLQSIMTTPVVTALPSDSIGHALSVMERERISAVVVADEDCPLGVFTERALIQLRVRGIIDYDSPIAEVMSAPPYTAPETMDYREAYQLLLRHRIRHLVVIRDDGQLAGIATGTDFLSHLGLEYFMEFKQVDQVMMKDVVTLPPEETSERAMRLMHRARISSLVIASDGVPKGIVTERDLLRLIRSGNQLDRLRLSRIMSSPVHTVSAGLSSHEAARKLLRLGVRRLVVVDENGEMLGIVTQTDMIRGLQTGYTDHLKEVIEQQAKQIRRVQKQADEAVILDSMLQSAGDIAIMILDRDLRIVHGNRSGFDLCLPESGLAMHIGNVVQTLPGLGKGQELSDLIQVAQDQGRHEVIIEQKRQGRSVFFATTLFPIVDRQGSGIGYGIIARDITPLKEAINELACKRQEAEEANIALQVMLDQHTRTRANIEEQVALRLVNLISPYLDTLRQSPLNEKQRELVHIITAHINAAARSFSPRAREIMLKLSPREIIIADLVRQGKRSKDIAEILGISFRTVETYRSSLRKKLGLKKRGMSLRSFLMTHFQSEDS